MRRISQAEIDEMRARGYDPETIREAQFSEKRTKEADALCDRVRKAFAGVKLGPGVGLFQGQAIDDYEPAEVQRKVRAKDEKNSWESIRSEDLCACSSSLSFFDAAGMKFHLPAFIIADLKDEYQMGLAFTLTYELESRREVFSLLTPEQRQVVREYLQFLREDPDSKFHRKDIDRALTGFWNNWIS